MFCIKSNNGNVIGVLMFACAIPSTEWMMNTQKPVCVPTRIVSKSDKTLLSGTNLTATLQRESLARHQYYILPELAADFYPPPQHVYFTLLLILGFASHPSLSLSVSILSYLFLPSLFAPLFYFFPCETAGGWNLWEMNLQNRSAISPRPPVIVCRRYVP